MSKLLAERRLFTSDAAIASGNGRDPHKPIRVATTKRNKVKAKPASKVKAKGKATSKVKVKAKAKPGAQRKLDPAKRDEFGLRLNSLRSKAAAMYASKQGATLNEVKAKLKSIQFNVLTQLKEAGYKVKESTEEGVGHRPVTRYHLLAR